MWGALKTIPSPITRGGLERDPFIPKCDWLIKRSPNSPCGGQGMEIAYLLHVGGLERDPPILYIPNWGNFHKKNALPQPCETSNLGN